MAYFDSIFDDGLERVSDALATDGAVAIREPGDVEATDYAATVGYVRNNDEPGFLDSVEVNAELLDIVVYHAAEHEISLESTVTIAGDDWAVEAITGRRPKYTKLTLSRKPISDMARERERR